MKHRKLIIANQSKLPIKQFHLVTFILLIEKKNKDIS